MKKYVNGFDKPKIEIVNNDGSITTVNFSFKYQGLREYYEVIGDLVTLPDGSKKLSVDHVDYEWTLDYPDHIESPDLLSFKDVENACIAAKTIWLTPHIDTWYRKFKVLVKPEQRVIDMDPHFGGRAMTANKGFRITFVNADRIAAVVTQDADYLPVVTAESCFEF